MRKIRWNVVVGATVLGAAVFSMPPASAAPQATPTAQTGVVTPMNASGCNVHTCIKVTGKKLYVESVTASTGGFYGHAHWPGCHRAQLLGARRGETWLHVLGTSSKVCSKAFFTSFSFKWYTKHNFPDGYQLCVQWIGLGGLPCEYIHK
ncbi:MAG: hypothetical protein JWN52_6126 [Actinomycetia bacterium]|nr:hypothetical protein [Actinomycetes bacterium]